MGERFTWTSNTFKKMLMRVQGAPFSCVDSTDVTFPSAGETIRPSPAGMVRSGSRKNQRKKAPSRIGKAAKASECVSQPIAAATTAIPRA